jgi:hypothetical protein
MLKLIFKLIIRFNKLVKAEVLQYNRLNQEDSR